MAKCNEHILKLVRKCIDGRCPQYFNNYNFVFNKYICTHSAQQSNLLHLPSMRMKTDRRSFYYCASTVFNKCCKLYINLKIIFTIMVVIKAFDICCYILSYINF